MKYKLQVTLTKDKEICDFDYTDIKDEVFDDFNNAYVRRIFLMRQEKYNDAYIRIVDIK